MMLFSRSKLAISLPAMELARIAVSGSVFSIEELDAERLSADLQAELSRLCSAFALSRSDIFIIPRPEIFTHGDTLSWLKDRLPNVQDHLCFSDGSNLKTVPNYANHIFFFRPYLRSCCTQLVRTLCRAPELFESYDTQINSAYSTAVARLEYSPETVLLQSPSRWPGESVVSYPFYLDPSRLDHTLAAAQAESQESEQATRWTRTTVICWTQACLHQTSFVRYVARLILTTFFTPQRRLILMAPTLNFSGLSAQERLLAIYTALLPHLGDLPRARASNIAIVMGALEDFQRERGQDIIQDLLLPASSAFWHSSVETYATIARIVIFPDILPSHPAGLQDLHMAAFGRAPSVAVLGDENTPLVIPELES